mmetsp:Transcript_2538/g.7532  ORF Transcript_2538/g.7532 Transcript_2538/m.7532 type:complete len:128 (-) Transcript_2538:577-960(-)
MEERETLAHHLDWEKAVQNHQSEEQFKAFLVQFPLDLQRIIDRMRDSLGDQERLREAAQQVMGSASYIAAVRLHKLASDLIEAIDLDEEFSQLATETLLEAEALAREIHQFAKSDDPTEKGRCCVLL